MLLIFSVLLVLSQSPLVLSLVPRAPETTGSSVNPTDMSGSGTDALVNTDSDATGLPTYISNVTTVSINGTNTPTIRHESIPIPIIGLTVDVSLWLDQRIAFVQINGVLKDALNDIEKNKDLSRPILSVYRFDDPSYGVSSYFWVMPDAARRSLLPFGQLSNAIRLGLIPWINDRVKSRKDLYDFTFSIRSSKDRYAIVNGGIDQIGNGQEHEASQTS